MIGTVLLMAAVGANEPVVAPPNPSLSRPRPIWSPGEVPYDATVAEEHTLIFQEPTLVAKVLRRVFVGEILHVVAEVDGADGRRWSEVAIGTEQTGYVESARLGRADRLPRSTGRVTRVLREERPIALATRAYGEGLGPMLALRYHPFSRIGLAAGYAIPVGTGDAVGWEAGERARLRAARIFSIGFISCLVLDDLSPVFEVGLGRLAVWKGDATLNLTTVYLSFGLEWMIPSGWFFGTAVAYVRSIRSNVSYAYAKVRTETPSVPDFGGFDPGPNDVFQAVSPSLTLGYAF